MSESPWLQAQRSHFDSLSHKYSSMYGDPTPFHDAMTNRFLDLSRIKAGMKILDLGCGPGRTTIPLLRKGCLVTGLDLSSRTLHLLENRLEELGLRKGFESRCQPAEDLEDRGEYDMVMGRGVLHHLSDPGRVLQKVHDSLRPGGKAVFMDPNPLQAAWYAFISLHPALRWRIESGVIRHTPWKNRRIFRDAGFADTEIFFLGLIPPPLWSLGALPSRAEQLLEQVPGLNRLGLYMVSIAHIRQ